eukprot:jgi/Botrbrau1/13838/Bobra.0056s0075.1
MASQSVLVRRPLAAWDFGYGRTVAHRIRLIPAVDRAAVLRGRAAPDTQSGPNFQASPREPTHHALGEPTHHALGEPSHHALSVPSHHALGEATPLSLGDATHHGDRGGSQPAVQSSTLEDLQQGALGAGEGSRGDGAAEGRASRRGRSLRKFQSRITRRGVVHAAGGLALTSTVANPLQVAAALPSVLDKAWVTLGGGPSDLFFPDEFLGEWEVASTLIKVDLPCGPEFVPDLRVVERAKKEDLNIVLRYKASFIRNGGGNVVIDRRYNTAQLLEVYMGDSITSRGDLVSWSPESPNVLKISLPGGAEVSTRVTRRSLDRPTADRINTSEFFEQIFQDSRSQQPRVKASRCFTKYKWRDLEAAEREGGPAIVATQVVSDYLTPDDGEELMLRAGDRPIVKYTYTMAFFKVPAVSV